MSRIEWPEEPGTGPEHGAPVPYQPFGAASLFGFVTFVAAALLLLGAASAALSQDANGGTLVVAGMAIVAGLVAAVVFHLASTRSLRSRGFGDAARARLVLRYVLATLGGLVLAAVAAGLVLFVGTAVTRSADGGDVDSTSAPFLFGIVMPFAAAVAFPVGFGVAAWLTARRTAPTLAAAPFTGRPGSGGPFTTPGRPPRPR